VVVLSASQVLRLSAAVLLLLLPALPATRSEEEEGEADST
jgi:hypothetical protein